MYLKLLISLVMVMLSSTCFAEKIYKWRDDNGVLHFSTVAPKKVDNSIDTVSTNSVNSLSLTQPHVPNIATTPPPPKSKSNLTPAQEALRDRLRKFVASGQRMTRATYNALMELEAATPELRQELREKHEMDEIKRELKQLSIKQQQQDWQRLRDNNFKHRY